MKKYRLIVPLILLAITAYCLRQSKKDAAAAAQKTETQSLQLALDSIISEVPGTVGVAYVCDTDTVVVNNDVKYGMMSVFKLHQAIALSRYFSETVQSLDSIVVIDRRELDSETWSPMLKDFPDADISISCRQLIDYALIQSDNNASNYLFNHVVSTAATDSIIRSIAPDTDFAIKFDEGAMKAEHQRCYDNFTSPLSATLLILELMKNDTLAGAETAYLRRQLEKVATGPDRIAAPILKLEGATIAHKTGSGFTNDKGELMAFNDVAFITLPGGNSYALGVFIRDFAGTEQDAAAVMREISEAALKFSLPANN